MSGVYHCGYVSLPGFWDYFRLGDDGVSSCRLELGTPFVRLHNNLAIWDATFHACLRNRLENTNTRQPCRVRFQNNEVLHYVGIEAAGFV